MQAGQVQAKRNPSSATNLMTWGSPADGWLTNAVLTCHLIPCPVYAAMQFASDAIIIMIDNTSAAVAVMNSSFTGDSISC
jgi:hypothetical protein